MGGIAYHRGAHVGDLDVAIFRQQQVGGLDVAVDDPVELGVVERAAALEHVFDDVGQRQQLVRRSVFFQRAAGDVFHYDETVVVAHGSVIDRYDVRMGKLADQGDLVEELAPVFLAIGRIIQHLIPEDLERDVALGERVVAEIDGAGRALAKFLFQLVFAQFLQLVHRTSMVRRLATVPGRGLSAVAAIQAVLPFRKTYTPMRI